jgi:hypothetical protein
MEALSMQKKLLAFLITMLIMMILAACSGKPTSSTQEVNKLVNIQVDSDPNPPSLGDVEFVITILDAQGNLFEGATIDISVEHIDMTGMEMNGVASQQSPGKYAITANFSMTGNWVMTVTVRKDGLEYQEDFSLKVQ